jgi:hypothetical protein
MIGVEGEAVLRGACGDVEDAAPGVGGFGIGEEEFDGVGVRVQQGARAELEAGELVDGAGLAENRVGDEGVAGIRVDGEEGGCPGLERGEGVLEGIGGDQRGRLGAGGSRGEEEN